MYLASTINEVLESKKSRLLGKNTYFHIINILNRAFKKVEPFKFKFELYEDYGKGDFSVSGLYDMSEDTRYIVINLPKTFKTFNIDEAKWKEFKFALSQVCQHETIHKLQWQHRDGIECDRLPLEFRSEISTKEEEQNYLNDVDEIDAYAHDIAMEIKFFYPKKDPLKVLQKLSRHKKIWSYVYYKRTFRGTNWSSIRNRLLKKTYLWLPHVTV